MAASMTSCALRIGVPAGARPLAPKFTDRNLIMKLVQSGLAVSFNAGRQYTEYPGIVVLPLADLAVEAGVHALIRKDAAANEPVKRILDYLKDFNT